MLFFSCHHKCLPPTLLLSSPLPSSLLSPLSPLPSPLSSPLLCSPSLLPPSLPPPLPPTPPGLHILCLLAPQQNWAATGVPSGGSEARGSRAGGGARESLHVLPTAVLVLGRRTCGEVRGRREGGREGGRDGGTEGRREGDEGLMHILCLNVSYEFMKNHLYKYYEKKEERKEEKERNKKK